MLTEKEEVLDAVVKYEVHDWEMEDAKYDVKVEPYEELPSVTLVYPPITRDCKVLSG